jgi:hypothetical protein
MFFVLRMNLQIGCLYLTEVMDRKWLKSFPTSGASAASSLPAAACTWPSGSRSGPSSIFKIIIFGYVHQFLDVSVLNIRYLRQNFLHFLGENI